jgi:hypothetical protein
VPEPHFPQWGGIEPRSNAKGAWLRGKVERGNRQIDLWHPAFRFHP